MVGTDPVHAHLVWLGDCFTSRGRNPDMVTINPAECKPGEVYEGTVGGKRLTLRRTPDNAYEWESFSDVHDDREVSDLVCLVPARPVTRHDLPSHGEVISLWLTEESRSESADAVLDAVVAHLNANGGTPVVMGQAANNMLRETLANVESDRDRWRRAHSIVEAERDTAREQAAKMCIERDGWRESVESVERERDEAEKAYCDLYDGHVAKVAKWRTRAVTREEIEKAIRTAYNQRGFGYTSGDIEVSTDAVWPLVSGSDPAVLVVRESDVAAVEVERVRDEEWHANGTLVAWTGESAEDVRGQQDTARRNFIHREAVARAIEQDAAADPITDAIRDGLNVWGTTDKGVRQIAESVRRAISNDGGENAI